MWFVFYICGGMTMGKVLGHQKKISLHLKIERQLEKKNQNYNTRAR